ncbi:MAG: hypothetical protein HGA86_04610, partial [Anaerolineaceae bacterium]|nr:hypothetical protein [Anaerolineaceae bacterium]
GFEPRFVVVGLEIDGVEVEVDVLVHQPRLEVVVVLVRVAFLESGRLVDGDAMSQDVLHRAGVEQAEALAAVTNSDALNAVIGNIARSVYQIPSVVVRNYDPILRPVFEAFDLQVVSSTSWGAQRIEEMIYNAEIHTVLSAGNGEVDIYEMLIPHELNGHKLSELLIPGCIPVSVTRAGKAFLPDADTTLLDCDILLVSATLEGIEAFRKNLADARAKGGK